MDKDIPPLIETKEILPEVLEVPRDSMMIVSVEGMAMQFCAIAANTLQVPDEQMMFFINDNLERFIPVAQAFYVLQQEEKEKAN